MFIVQFGSGGKVSNIDTKTVGSFGDEWSRFDESEMSDDEAHKIFKEYFSVFPWEVLPPRMPKALIWVAAVVAGLVGWRRV